MRQAPDRLAKVATVFNSLELAATKSYLEAHDTMVVAEPFHLVHNFPHYATLVGGIPVLVPEAQAGQALELLNLIENDGIDAERRGLVFRLFLLVVFVTLAGWAAAPPSSGRVLHPGAAVTPRSHPARI